MVASAYGRLPLNALRVFEAVASRLSFGEAAEALNVTPAAVSQQIKALEDYLQMPVLRRSGRKVELTPEGARLLPGIRAGLDSLVVALREMRMMRASGIINVSTLSSLMQKWMTPRLHRLHAKFPDLQVDWHTSREAVDFTRSDFHAAVRLGEAQAPGLDYEKLMDEWIVVVASPELYKRHGSIDDRESLAGIPMLQAKDEPWSALREERRADALAGGPDDHRRFGQRALRGHRGARLRARALVDRRARSAGRSHRAREQDHRPVAIPLLVRLPALVLGPADGLRAAPVAQGRGRRIPDAPGLARQAIKGTRPFSDKGDAPLFR